MRFNTSKMSIEISFLVGLFVIFNRKQDAYRLILLYHFSGKDTVKEHAVYVNTM